IDGSKNALKFIVLDKQICSSCYVFDFTDKCPKCHRRVCEACVLWKYEHDDNMSIIEADCPVCSSIIYHDFY
ncbi:MAG: hypothetical protein WA667_26695, partial [Candidatus Nitrosopolaris sp.]